MVLSTQTLETGASFGDIKAIKMFAEAGFDAIDYSMHSSYCDSFIFGDGYKDYCLKLRRAADKAGLYYNQAHAPFPSYVRGDSDYNGRIIPALVRAVEAAGELGVKNIVVHPVAFPENQKQNNLDLYNFLKPHAKKAGVKIALENMWGIDPKRGYIVHNVCSSPEELSEYYDALDPEYFSVCLDLGHCGLVGEDAAEFIKVLGAQRLQALHIHDNNYKEDSHFPPYTHLLDWDKITAALREIGYKGDFTLEADSFLTHMPKELYPSALRFMHDSGRLLIKKFEGAE